VFCLVGAFCFAVQTVILVGLATAGLYEPLANAIGFFCSAQVNYLLSSRLTWGDRDRARLSLPAYNAVALFSLAVNSAVFVGSYRFLWTPFAAALGVVSGMFITYLLCDRILFRARSVTATQPVKTEEVTV
jgi:putative flippase GtrA